MLNPGSAVYVRKLKPNGQLHYQWDGRVLRCDDEGIVLRAEFNVDLVERDFATFRRGDVFHEFYYWDRAYNVFEVSTSEGALKGWYLNLGLPAQLADTGELSYVDLALDIWANPDGTFVVLDDDELQELLEAHPELAETAEQGRATLIKLAESGEFPRWEH